MILSMNTKNKINDLKTLEDIFDFSKNHELFSNENKKKIGKFKMETPKIIWIG